MAQILDDELVSFLQWALPRLGYRWEGYRKVRGQVKKRISQRLDELGLESLGEYRSYLEGRSQEWELLDQYCRITISRFYRDRVTWDELRRVVLPTIACAVRGRDGEAVRAWSVGSASGEEPYTLRLCWELDERRPWRDLRLEVDAIDAAPHMVERARRGRYPWGNLKELPTSWREQGFEESDGEYRLRSRFRQGMHFAVADMRDVALSKKYHLVFCRNLAFMYFDAAGRRRALRRIARATNVGAALVVGNHDLVADEPDLFRSWPGVQNVWRRSGD